jgi:hypothetical protein
VIWTNRPAQLLLYQTASQPVASDKETEPDQRTIATDGMYSALVTQRSGPIQGASGSPGSATMVSKQAQIGMITTPSFLADLKK